MQCLQCTADAQRKFGSHEASRLRCHRCNQLRRGGREKRETKTQTTKTRLNRTHDVRAALGMRRLRRLAEPALITGKDLDGARVYPC
jgi:hypothetical protein